MDETSVPSMRIVPNTGQKRGERRGERREEEDRSRLEMKESRGEDRRGEERKRRIKNGFKIDVKMRDNKIVEESKSKKLIT